MFFLSRWSGGLVARYGPRLPLISGPLIAAFGFVLIAVPSISGDYWTTFFPAIMILGFGMAVTVAPLTTVVMNSVSQERVGTASGVNNAVARVAGVLAIAVFGVVMVKAFGSRLNHSLRDLPLPAQVVQQLQANEVKLGALPVPQGLDSGGAAAVKHSIAEGFVFGFRIVMLVCAGLSVASAATAWRMIPSRSRTIQG